MTSIKPFKAVIYNPDKVKDLSRVICPPYDIISPQRQQYYHDLDPSNFIHILLGKDIPGEDKYVRAGGIFAEWLKSKVFIRDEKPAIYFYSHQYNLKGEKRIRLGFIALLRLDKGSSSVFGHEHTHLEAKEDRLRLIRQVKASLSPIFVVFSDQKRTVQRIYQQYTLDKKPFIEVTDDDKNIHKLWRLDSPDAIAAIESGMMDENVFIADGHHRYEVARAFRDEMKQANPTAGDDADFNYCLAYFTNTESRGLTILPIHRLLKLEVSLETEKFTGLMGNYFDLEEVKDKTRFFFLMQKGGRAEHLLGAYVNKRFWLLRLRNIKILDKIISDKPREYRTLDVAMLNYICLKKIMGVDPDDKGRLSFNPNADELIEQVNRDNSCVAFFLNPVKVEQIIAVALTGNKMPPKSTYFYPKVISGLLINKFDI